MQREKVDLIFSSCSPYTSAFIAMELKKEFNIPWVAEWRDLWSGNEFLNLSYDKTLIKPLRQLLKFRIIRAEREIVKIADKTVVLSWRHKQQLCELHGAKEEKIEVVTNGYDELDFKELKAIALYPDKLTIVCLGSLYSGYQQIVLKFLSAVNETSKDAEVVFIGRAATVLQGTNAKNLTNILYLAKEKALAFASGADFFLLLTIPSTEWVLATELYEYLRLGKPILALVPKDGDAAKIVEEARAGFVLSYEQEEMKEQLKAIFDQWREGKFKSFHPDWEYVSQFECRNLATRLVDIFNKAIAR